MGIFSNIKSIGDLLLTGFSLVVLIGGITAITAILYGGIKLILSGGKEDKIKNAVNTIRYAIYGIIAIVASIYIFPIFGRLLGINVEQYASPMLIFDKVTEIGNLIFKTTNDLGYYNNDIDLTNIGVDENVVKKSEIQEFEY